MGASPEAPVLKDRASIYRPRVRSPAWLKAEGYEVQTVSNDERPCRQ
jgi:hypothetical protein